MRILQLNPVGVIGGAERVLLGCVRAVREFLPGSSVAVVLLGDGPLAEAARRAGAEVVVVPLPPALAGLGDSQLRGNGKLGTLVSLTRTAMEAGPSGFEFLRTLRHIVRRLRPDLIHTHGLKAHALARLAKPPGVPVVWHLHDFFSERPVMAKVLRHVRGGVVGGIAISTAVKRDAEMVLPGLPLTVVHNAVDTEHFAPGPADGADLDRLAGLTISPPDTVRIGLIATYANWKGHHVFLDSLGRLPGNVRGYVIGGPIYATAGSQVTQMDLEAQAKRLGLLVGFVPFQPDPANVYRMLDIVVHASTRPEPFGLTIAEAMSCGKPTVVAAAGGAVELFADGVSAIGHRPGDVDNLATALIRLISDGELRSRLGLNARQTALDRFSPDRFGRELVATYRSC